MRKRKFQRRRRVLLNADVVGFSAMVARDAPGTIDALLDNTRWLARAVSQFGGRVIDSPGDNLVAQFTDETAAIKCAMYVQWHEQGRNAHLPEHLRISFRIGIDVGDVLELQGRLFGNAVNIAARLQAAADRGGIVVSEAVAARWKANVPLLGDHQQRYLKNIPTPVSTLALYVHGLMSYVRTKPLVIDRS